MNKIKITHNPEKTTLEALGGRQRIGVVVLPNGRKSAKFGAGDLVIFPSGMSCTWGIVKDAEKQYTFG